MTLTEEEKVVLRVLVEKELKAVKEAGDIMEINSPFIGKGVKGKGELPFLKSEVLYEKFLQHLLKKL
jgi:hypothetical protein